MTEAAYKHVCMYKSVLWNKCLCLFSNKMRLAPSERRKARMRKRPENRRRGRIEAQRFKFSLSPPSALRKIILRRLQSSSCTDGDSLIYRQPPPSIVRCGKNHLATTNANDKEEYGREGAERRNEKEAEAPITQQSKTRSSRQRKWRERLRSQRKDNWRTEGQLENNCQRKTGTEL